MLLAVMMVISTMPGFVWAAGTTVAPAKELTVAMQVSPTDVNDAVKNFSSALMSFYTDTSQLSQMSAFLTRFGGITSITSGVIGILQMAGIIKDSTFEILGKVLDEVYRIQAQIEEIDKKLDDLHEDLIKVAVSQEEKDRNNKADTMIKNWNDFNTHYCEPLDDKIKEYQAKVDLGIKSWWGLSSHDGVRVLYTDIKGTPSLTYSDNSYGEGFPAKAGNGEKIDLNQRFGVPAAYIPDTKALSFNINDYRSKFETAMAAKFVEAANAHQLDASETFYNNWNKLSNTAKDQKARAYATDILNTQIYHIACDVMNNNHEWVTSVTNAYRNYCKNVLQQDSGINAMLNAMYLSHGFEGEIKKELDTFCEGMIAKAGLYGQFALTCACQDNMESLTNREEVQALFTGKPPESPCF